MLEDLSLVYKQRYRERKEKLSSVYLGMTWAQAYNNGPTQGYIYSPANQYGNIERTWDYLHPGPPYRVGGSFRHIQAILQRYPQGICETRAYGPWITYINPDNYLWQEVYIGGFVPNISTTGSDGVVLADFENIGTAGTTKSGFRVADGDASGYGATAWNRFKPKQSDADLGVFLGEIQEVPKMLQTTAKGFHDTWRRMGGSSTGKTIDTGSKELANHWLNTQFGWRPFLGDLSKFYSTYKTADRRLRQLKSDNAKWIRRRGTISIPESDSVNTYVSTNRPMVYPSLSTRLYANSNIWGTCVVSKQVENSVWFSGCFRYYVPSYDAPDNAWSPTVNDYIRLYGARISPSLVWNLTPWSWLADWSTNLGSIVSNLDSTLYDNLAAKYAYVMRTQRTVYTIRSWINLANHIHGGENCEWHWYATSKNRTQANPFGFSLSPTLYSGRQWSILAALGITRFR